MYRYRSITVKTQVRRLKYLSVILNSLNPRGNQLDFLAKKVISWSEKNHKHLLNYSNSSGEITNESSFKNYIAAASLFNIVNSHRGLILPSRIGNVMKEINKLSNTVSSQNSFILSNSEKMFYIYNILKADADRLLTILSMINEIPGGTVKDHQKEFKTYYYSRLSLKLNFCKGNEKEKVYEALSRIKNWRSPIRYSEDIVPPRINWMLDLGLIKPDFESNSNKIYLNNTGLCILNYLKNTSEHELIDINDHWLNSKFAYFNSLLINRPNCYKWENISEETQFSLLSESLEYSYTLFSSLNLPRLPIEPTFLFVIIWLLDNYNTLINFNQIENWIGFNRIIKNKKFGIRKSARNSESYIVISDA